MHELQYKEKENVTNTLTLTFFNFVGFFSEKLVDCWVGVLFWGHPQRASVDVCTSTQPIQNFHLKKNFGCSTVRSILWERKVGFTSKTGLKALSVCMKIKLIATALFLFGFSFFWSFIDGEKVHCSYLPYLLKGAPLFSHKRMPILQEVCDLRSDPFKSGKTSAEAFII